MKKLISPGVTVVLNSRSTFAPFGQGSSARIFPIGNFRLADDPPFDLLWDWTLASGHVAEYGYRGLGDRAGADQDRFDRLQRVYAGGHGTEGGILFNQDIRSTLVSKSIVG